MVLDPDSGELVSRNELKKQTHKRAKKASAAMRRAEQASGLPNPHDSASSSISGFRVDGTPADPDAMFKQGYLADVFKERPVKPVVTRFPPGPNGFLHLGHAKAIAINFGFARYHGGETILRFDDTNPDEEEQVYFEWMIEVIRWLGFTPSSITYSSDSFQKLYDLAIELIKRDKAYVCHCTEAEIKRQRGGTDGKEGARFRCQHAEQDTSVNLRKFRDMHDGEYQPLEAVLRMKQDMESGNPHMWDLTAYRIPKKTEQHVRAPQWKIFPTYDFAHCLCDSLEGITHSLCSAEFIQSRESCEWLNKTLEVYEPMQREFGRLNISGTILSKRALRKLVESYLVRGWHDPRLYNLIALRRRGIPPGALLAFINELGVTRTNAIIRVERFEQAVRKYLETTVPRLMLVLDPVLVTIEDCDEELKLDVPFSSKDPALGSYRLHLSNTIFIDRSDFREVGSSDYFRLAPGNTVGLINVPYPIRATSFSKDDKTGKVTEVRAVFDTQNKPKAYVQWVPNGSVNVEVRIHSPLFKSDDPMAADGGFMSDINRDSETVFSNALIGEGFDEVRRRAPWPETASECEVTGPEGVRFQAMRVGYFAMDCDSTEEKLVFNRVVSLKEDARKN